MAEVVVIGAGVAGLGSALALGRQGHRVRVLERDATPLPATAEEAFGWDRQGAPQVRHSHALLARLRNLLRDRYPDVLQALLDAGASEIRFCDQLPADMTDRSPRDGDGDLVALACRRTTFEWVLRRAVLDEATVELSDGVAVDGLAVEPGDPPTVRGVEISGSRSPIDADVVVAANGRRSPLPVWLTASGVEIAEESEDTGIVYYSRFYRLRDEAETPVQEGPIGGDLGYLKYAVFQGDNRTFSITFAAWTDDDELRRRLRDPDVFDHAARTLPATAPWADQALAEPITEVFVMARLLNRRRTFCVDDRPLVRGLFAVGDAHTCTNPLYGRGCSLALVQATLLADVLADPVDQREAAVDYERLSAQEIEPWYQSAVTQDRQGRRWVERERQRNRGESTSHLDDDPGVQMIDLLRDGFLPAVREDPHVFRAFLRTFNLLDPPSAMLSDPVVMARVLETYQDRENRPPPEPLGPPRREMLAALC